MKTMAYLEVCIGQGQESNSLECSSPTGWAPCFWLSFSPESRFVLLCQSVNSLPNLYRTNLDDLTCPRWFDQLFCYADNGRTSARPCTNCNASPGVHRTSARTIRTKVAGARFPKTPFGRYLLL